MLGLRKGETEFHRHDPKWASEAKQTISQLKAVFKDYACDIQHIGSTAVKKIKAKPVIDIAVGVSDLRVADILKKKLKFSGFILDNARSNEKRRIFFRLAYSEKDNASVKTHNIYVVQHNSKLWLDYIIFRDYLNINDGKAHEYESLKLTLKGKYKYSLPSYVKAKADFIRQTIDDNFCAMLLGKSVTININLSLGSANPASPADVQPPSTSRSRQTSA